MADNEEQDDRTTLPFESFVKEAPLIVQQLEALAGNDEKARETTLTKLETTLDKYQQQPQLLDPHLSNLVSTCFRLYRAHATRAEVVHAVFRILYSLIKVRGYITILKFFPHEVADFQPTLTLLRAQDRADFATWQTRYVLLLWLSVGAMTPFGLSTVLSAVEGQDPIQSLIDLAKSFLGDTGRTSEAAGVLLSRLLTRPDVLAKYFDGFLAWCVESVATWNEQFAKNERGNVFLVTGILAAVKEILKQAPRADLLPRLDVLARVGQARCSDQHTNMRQMVIKVAQRLGLVYLKPRDIKWRYRRGGRSLLNNMNAAGAPGAPAAAVTSSAPEEEEEDIEVDEAVADILTKLRDGLRDRDTIVRWSAAKGIGRITDRLPGDIAADIVDNISSLLSLVEGDSAWHGACLALAELARRGLLLPERLGAIIPLIIKALAYDVASGAHSVGAHVRDAACYVCWAFARAYDPSIMQPFVGSIAPALICCALFDREVNCRRAASAAFQENVGRLGNFPHGIDVQTAADYFAVGNRTNAFTEVALYIAQHPEYRSTLLEHLLGVKLFHWDPEVRALTSRALGVLTPRDSAYMRNTAIATLLKDCTSQQLNRRHGAILGVAEIVAGLHALGLTPPAELIEAIVNIAKTCSDAGLFKGKAGEYVLAAACRLVETISAASLPASVEAIDVSLYATVDAGLGHALTDIQEAAAAALAAFSKAYCVSPSGELKDDGVRRCITVNIERLGNVNVTPVRHGAALALGFVAPPLILAALPAVLEALRMAAVHGANVTAEPSDAQTRTNALRSLISIFKSCRIPEDFPGFAEDIVNTLVTGAGDFSVDRRGDVGSWARDVALEGLAEVTVAMTTAKDSAGQSRWTPAMCDSTMCAVVGEASEKMDRMREKAGNILERLVLSKEPVIPHIPHHAQLIQLVTKLKADALAETGNELIWSIPKNTFPFFGALMALGVPYSAPVLESMVTCAGGLTESLLRASQEVLVEVFKTASDGDFIDLVMCLARLLVRHARDERVFQQTVRSLKTLFETSEVRSRFRLTAPPASTLMTQIFEQVRDDYRENKDPKRIRGAVQLFGAMLMFEQPLQQRVLEELLRLLGHKFPNIRVEAATTLALNLELASDPGLMEKWTACEEIIIGTDWSTNDAAEMRTEVYRIFGITPPAKVRAKAKPVAKAAPGATGTYQDLVRSSGF